LKLHVQWLSKSKFSLLSLHLSEDGLLVFSFWISVDF
jgi:hypothetical protein